MLRRGVDPLPCVPWLNKADRYELVVLLAEAHDVAFQVTATPMSPGRIARDFCARSARMMLQKTTHSSQMKHIGPAIRCSTRLLGLQQNEQ
jgi:hypothetical protein